MSEFENREVVEQETTTIEPNGYAEFNANDAYQPEPEYGYDQPDYSMNPGTAAKLVATGMFAGSALTWGIGKLKNDVCAKIEEKKANTPPVKVKRVLRVNWPIRFEKVVVETGNNAPAESPAPVEGTEETK